MEDNNRITYLATVAGNGLSLSKENSTPAVTIRLRTIHNVATPEISENITLFARLWLTYKTIGRTLKTLQEVFGWKGKGIEDFDEPILVGKKCNVVCETREYQGKESLEVIFINKAGGIPSLPMEDLKRLVADVQPMINEALGISPPPDYSSESVGDPLPMPEDDLPF